MDNNLNGLTILRGILKDEVFSEFAKYANGDSAALYEFLYRFYNKKRFTETGGNFMHYVEKLVFFSENAFTSLIAAGKNDSYLLNAYIRDMSAIFSSVENCACGDYFSAERVLRSENESIMETLLSWCNTYRRDGYGRFLESYALTYCNGDVVPSGNDDDINLDSLKDYKEEKAIIEKNILNFLDGFPHSDMLLYGDRGTGKSSTLRATVKKFFSRKLRLIELGSDNIDKIPAIRNLLIKVPMKFIIFIDDLSVSENDSSLSYLKSYIEGSATASANTMIAATSNRRHIIKESFSERQNAVHMNDVLQEQLALSDRFGISVMFSSTGKAQYLSIVKQLAEDKKLAIEENKLCDLAERWALMRGDRSPRRAKQFIDMAYSAQLRNEEITF